MPPPITIDLAIEAERDLVRVRLTETINETLTGVAFKGRPEDATACVTFALVAIACALAIQAIPRSRFTQWGLIAINKIAETAGIRTLQLATPAEAASISGTNAPGGSA